MPSNCNWIIPSWPAPRNILAFTTVRQGGVSKPPFDSFNLAQHVQDDPIDIAKNREILKTKANLPNDPFWLNQVHGIEVVTVGDYSIPYPLLEADASVAFQPNQVSVVLTADCLPVLLCNKQGTCISAVHAGWRGLSKGVIEAAVLKMACDPKDLLVWLGPGIGPSAFEVGEEVLLAFKNSPQGDTAVDSAFKKNDKDRWFADLYQLARFRLSRLGVKDVYGGEFCTYSDPERFYSARRSKITGRMATVICALSDPHQV